MKQCKNKTTGAIFNKAVNGNSYYSDKYQGYFIPSELVENSCDYEEMIERDFEILTERGSICIGSSKIEIVSAKRLSDGVVFSLGEFVTNGVPNKIKITEFKIVEEKLRVYTDNDYSGYNLIKSLIKPLFTTFDGVDIFEGNIIYSLYKDSIHKNVAGSTVFFNETLLFSTEIAAKNYKRDNEKKFSLNDIKETVEKLNCFGSTLIEYLEKTK
jgi:hypothetical protein